MVISIRRAACRDRSTASFWLYDGLIFETDRAAARRSP
jgi:hypothetical protein